MGEHAAYLLMLRRFCLRALLWMAPALSFTSNAEARGAPSKPPDLIITNARIYTVNPKQPWAEAVAIRDGRIAAVGAAHEVMILRGPRTRVLDARQHLVLPGFIDSHIHFIEGSLSLRQLRLDETGSIAEIQDVIRKHAASHPAQPGKDSWIVGRGWTYAEFGAEAMPHKKYIDEIVPDRPVLLEGFDGHTYWANGKALALAGITRTTPDPRNGKIVRDQDGEPTGALQESAGDLVVRIVPRPSRQQRLTALREGMALANRVGLTRVIICGNDTAGASDSEFAGLYDQLRRDGELTLRFKISKYIAPDADYGHEYVLAEQLSRRFPEQNEWLEAGAVKMFLDGVIEGHTAAFLAPYADDPAQSGSLRWDPERYRSAVAGFDQRGIQIFTHAIGDRAVRLALDAYESAAQQNHTHDARHRVEHIETISAQDIPRFGSLKVIASFQPLHAYPDDDTLGPWLQHAGKERAARAWAWRDIAKSGGTLAFGSDWPVVTLNPWEGVQNAVTRQTREGKPEGGWIPEQRISLAQAIEGYTLGAAIGGRREKWEGSIEPGKFADMIVLEQDLFAIDPHQIANTEVLLTIVGGKTVYESPAWAQARTKVAAKKSSRGH
jgi:predicted amidohydrolase YtcJ